MCTQEHSQVHTPNSIFPVRSTLYTNNPTQIPNTMQPPFTPAAQFVGSMYPQYPPAAQFGGPMYPQHLPMTVERPEHWAPGTQKSVPLDPTDAEYRKVVAFFMSSAGDGFSVKGVERLQNKGQWDIYQFRKRQMEERKAPSSTDRGADEKQLFHGTDETTARKIVDYAFNRSFCGKNATVYGHGVYFARDARYSTDDTYSRPNASGVKHIVQSRVLVGTYAAGNSGMIEPPMRDGRLCDTTVDNTANPSIFVAYHDAQVGK